MFAGHLTSVATAINPNAASGLLSKRIGNRHGKVLLRKMDVSIWPGILNLLVVAPQGTSKRKSRSHKLREIIYFPIHCLHHLNKLMMTLKCNIDSCSGDAAAVLLAEVLLCAFPPASGYKSNSPAPTREGGSWPSPRVSSMAWLDAWLPSMLRVRNDRLGESPARPLPCFPTQRSSQHAIHANKGRRRCVASFSLRGCAFLCVAAAAASELLWEQV